MPSSSAQSSGPPGGAVAQRLVPALDGGILVGAGCGVAFALLAAARATSAGAALAWGLGFSFLAWVAIPVGLASALSGGAEAMGMLAVARARFPDLVAYLLCLGAPRRLAAPRSTRRGARGAARRGPPRGVAEAGIPTGSVRPTSNPLTTEMNDAPRDGGMLQGATGVLAAHDLGRGVVLDDRDERLRIDGVGPPRLHLEDPGAPRNLARVDVPSGPGVGSRDRAPRVFVPPARHEVAGAGPREDRDSVRVVEGGSISAALGDSRDTAPPSRRQPSRRQRGSNPTTMPARPSARRSITLGRCIPPSADVAPCASR